MNKHKFKHRFTTPTHPEPSAPLWLGRKCKFCGKVSGLDDWQLTDMPVDMAICEKSTLKMGFWERFVSQSVNCL